MVRMAGLPLGRRRGSRDESASPPPEPRALPAFPILRLARRPTGKPRPQGVANDYRWHGRF